MAAPTDESLLEKAIGGLPLVQTQGLNTNKAVNFSGFQVDTSGNLTTSGTLAVTGTVNYGVSEITGATGSAAVLGTAGASAGGPTAAQQDGWLPIKIAGVSAWIPVWK